MTSILNRSSRASQGQVVFKHDFPPVGFFPLPPAEPHLCRDAYLKALLAPYESIPEDESNVTEDDWIPTKGLFATKKLDFEYMMISTRRTTKVRPTTYQRPSGIGDTTKTAAVDINALVKARSKKMLEGLTNSSINYLLEKFIKKIVIMRFVPPKGTNPSKTIFGWSCREYYERFKKNEDTMYLDALVFGKTEKQLDALKFFVDLGEIIRLIISLKEDLIANRDLCQGFMALLRDIKVDIMEVLAKPYEAMNTEHDNIVVELIKIRQGKAADPQSISKRRALKKEQELFTDYKYPIETRYQINWARDKVEQKYTEDAIKEKAMQDELDKLQELTKTDTNVWRSAYIKYSTLIEEYKKRINLMQDAYDEDMESAENDVQFTLNKLNKCKDDLNTYQEKVQMFHVKIAETRAKIAIEEQEELEKLRKLEEKAARKSSMKEKAKAKGKGKEKKKK
ncbi:uncharacterized protein [Drosophila pseudoobscura]|uniref:Dynein regulatory complex protein 10 n=1 Tax=Drosophila pseudoobscura pseudoobscura TaxID=46245 RepID=A0A6I8UXP4_DROPS|nr:uncharacterized protein LOC6903084 [Drosophila pseudoobscura]